MQQTVLARINFKHKGTMCTMVSKSASSESAKSLKRWFLDDIKTPLEVALKIKSVNKIWYLGDGLVVKEQSTSASIHEFYRLLRAEKISDSSPKDPVLLINGEKGYITTPFVEGLPLSLLSHEKLSDQQALQIVCKSFRAIGKLHYGNGILGVLHNDVCINNIICTLDEGRPAVFVDFAASKIVKRSTDSHCFAEELGKLVFNLYLVNLIRNHQVQDLLEHYMFSNPEVDKKSLELILESNLSLLFLNK